MDPFDGAEEWRRHYDDNYKAYYYYNSVTGESKWEEEAASASNDNELEDVQLTTCAESAEKQSSTPPPSKDKDKERESTHLDTPQMWKDRNHKALKRGKENNKKKPKASNASNSKANSSSTDKDKEIDGRPLAYPDSNSDTDEEGNNNFSSSMNDSRHGLLIQNADRVFADTEADLNRYSRVLYCNACVLEGPLAVLEGLFRSLLFTFLCLICLCCALPTSCQNHKRTFWMQQAKLYGREAVLCAAAAVSFLLIPFASCAVYRRYHHEEEWDVAPVPTVLGWVDTRRFASFALLGGSVANNKQDKQDTLSFKDSLSGERTDGGGGGGPKLDLGDVNLSSSEDSWGGGILFAPRKAYGNLMRIVRGEGEEDMHEFVELAESRL